MGKEETNRVKVLTIKGVCEVLNCNRMYFYRNYRSRLNAHPTTKSGVYYKESDVNKLLEEIEREDSDIMIVK